MWYVLQADKQASLITGFNKSLSKEEYLRKIASGDLMEVLNQEKVTKGDVFFLPAGRLVRIVFWIRFIPYILLSIKDFVNHSSVASVVTPYKSYTMVNTCKVILVKLAGR